jgi:predicted Zn-dependent protease
MLSALLPLLLAAGCAVNPVSGRPELALISEPQEVAIGQQAAQEAAKEYGLVDDPALRQYVEGIGKRLAAKSERPNLPWTFNVVDDPTPNAFALPGGPIFVTRGLLVLMNSEAQLATVVGHEVGHVTARHSVNQMSKQQLAQIGLGIGAALGADQLAGLASQGFGLLFLKYGRDDERQADELGFRYALDQGYDVREMAKVFEALERSTALAGVQKMPDWAASHPAEPERIENVHRRVAALGPDWRPGTVGEAEYLKRVDGLAYGDDPRHGFFRAGTFYHPELKFQFTVPADWKTQNGTSAVVAVTPKNDGAAQLSLVPKLAPEQAAQQFAGQQAVQAGPAARRTVNGIATIVVPFQGQTQQGTVAGLAAFFAHGGQTYRLATFSPAAAYAAQEPTFRRVLESFAPLTDPKVLAVRTPRLQVVRLERPTTLAAFAAEKPNVLPLERLAVLNQVADGTVPLPAGTLVKRVVGDLP